MRSDLCLVVVFNELQNYLALLIIQYNLYDTQYEIGTSGFNGLHKSTKNSAVSDTLSALTLELHPKRVTM